MLVPEALDDQPRAARPSRWVKVSPGGKKSAARGGTHAANGPYFIEPSTDVFSTNPKPAVGRKSSTNTPRPDLPPHRQVGIVITLMKDIDDS
jgi:hypothetical protein